MDFYHDSKRKISFGEVDDCPNRFNRKAINYKLHHKGSLHAHEKYASELENAKTLVFFFEIGYSSSIALVAFDVGDTRLKYD